jgi:hypothetical protein
MAAWLSRGLPSAGLYAGPLAWLAGTVANYALVPWMCAHKVRVVPMVAFALVAVSLFGAFLSWRGYAAANPPPDPTGAGRPHRFVGAIGVLTGLLFALVILVHAAAGLTFTGCER